MGQKLIRKTINILIIIKREAKKIIVYVLCTVAATWIGSQSSAYMRKSEVDQLPMQDQPRIELPMHNPGLVPTGDKSITGLKGVASENPKPKISLRTRNLLGQSQVKELLRGGDKDPHLNEFPEIASQVDKSTIPNNSANESLLRDLKKHIEELEKSENSEKSNVGFAGQLFHDFVQFLVAYRDEIVGLYRSYSNKNQGSWPLPGAKGFVNKDIPTPQRETKPYQKTSSLDMGRPKIRDEDLYDMVNLPADVENHKLGTVSPITYNKKLKKVFKKTASKPKNQKEVGSLLEQVRSGNMNPGLGTRRIRKSNLFELRGKSGTRILGRKRNQLIEVIAVFDKESQKEVLGELKTLKILTPEQLEELGKNE